MARMIAVEAHRALDHLIKITIHCDQDDCSLQRTCAVGVGHRLDEIGHDACHVGSYPPPGTSITLATVSPFDRSAGGGNRTHTTLLGSSDFKSDASASSATPAQRRLSRKSRFPACGP